MKKFLLIVSIVLLLAAACNQQPVVQQNTQTPVQPAQNQPTPQAEQTKPTDATANWKTYTNTKYGFELQYPKDFILNNKTDGMSLSSGQECNSITGAWPTNCLTYALIIQKDKIGGVDQDKTTMQVAGYLADRGTLKGGMNDNMEQIYVQFYKNNNWYISYITYNVSQKSLADSTLNKILSTFKFSNPVAALVPNIFDFASVKLGQKYGAMTVAKINSNNNNSISADNIHVEFTGNTTLVGILSAPIGNPEDAGMGPEYSLNDLTIDSLKKLPYLKTDTRTIWFGIRNPETIKNAGVKNRDKVELTISRYYYTFFPAGVWNEADTVSIKKTQ